MTIEEQVVTLLRQLPTEKQSEVLDFAEFLLSRIRGMILLRLS